MKKTIKFLLLFGIIIILLIPIFGSAEEEYMEGKILKNMLEELNGDFLEGDINMGGTISNEFLNQEDLNLMAKDIRLKMKIQGEKTDSPINMDDLENIHYYEEFINEDNFKQLTIYGYDLEKNPITIMMASYIDSYTGNPETTLFINLIKKGKNFDINGIMIRIEDIFKEFHIPTDITTCIIGSLEGRQEEKILKEEVNRMMEKFDLKVVEKYIDESIISYTAYTPLIEGSIYSGKKEVNLNLAIRYNEYEDRSYIWIGTPIITMGY